MSALQPNQDENPCLHCGACCAYFRVEFYWRETEPYPNYEVPHEMTEDLDSFKKCMKGTSAKRRNQCVALHGRIGEKVFCTIYENRPSPCRSFKASYVEGVQNKRCNEARAAHGLPPLFSDLKRSAGNA